MDEEVDLKKLRYVIYARKSTDDPQRQVRSIGDQVDECLILAKNLGLNIIKEPIKEQKSAKTPDKRPLFTQMLKDIRSGKIDGIVSWNPDRLSRNMKEAGEIIDMVDANLIKDMKFVTHHFSKDANGKMLLGMAFVLSKQYSDNLSQNVKRGVRKKFLEGKSPTPKYGYIQDEYQHYIPDKKNFQIFKNIWKLKKEGKTYEYIAEYLNTSGFKRVTKSGGKKLYIQTKTQQNIQRSVLLWNSYPSRRKSRS